MKIQFNIPGRNLQFFFCRFMGNRKKTVYLHTPGKVFIEKIKAADIKSVYGLLRIADRSHVKADDMLGFAGYCNQQQENDGSSNFFHDTKWKKGRHRIADRYPGKKWLLS